MPATASDLGATETLVISYTNKVREREKLQPLAANKALTIAAQSFARYLAATKTFSHSAGGTQPAMRAADAGYEYCQIAENLAMSETGQAMTPEALARETVEGWLNSPGHRANMVTRYATDIGVGAAALPGKERAYVVVEMIGRPKALAAEFQISNATKSPVRYTLSGAAFTVQPGSGVRHTSCEPKTIEFIAAGNIALKGAYPAETGKVYTVSERNGSASVSVSLRAKLD